jgi:[acyl-carrier-protein] S-malonyltransferase
MGHDLHDNFDSARAIFKQADEILGIPLTRLCFDGPEEELRLTINAQPALVTASYACLKAAEELAPDELPAPSFVAGHSLGEYTALAAADSVDFPTAVYLAKERGRLMHEAGTASPGSMAAIIGLDEDTMAELCDSMDIRIANYNSPGQMVISGAKENIDRAIELAKEKGASRVIPLAVSGAFHTPLMQPAVDGMAEAIAGVTLGSPAVPVVANTTARPMTTTEEIKSELLNQLCNSVQWQRSIEYMIDNGVSTFIEIGPGRVLSGLTKRINREVATLNLGDVESIRNLNKPA